MKVLYFIKEQEEIKMVEGDTIEDVCSNICTEECDYIESNQLDESEFISACAYYMNVSDMPEKEIQDIINKKIDWYYLADWVDIEELQF